MRSTTRIANYLNRPECGEAGDGVRDEFPDFELFKVTAEMVVDETVAGEDK